MALQSTASIRRLEDMDVDQLIDRVSSGLRRQRGVAINVLDLGWAGRSWADGVTWASSIDRATGRVLVPGSPSQALGSIRRAVTAAVAHDASRLELSASATDGRLVVALVDDGGPRPTIERSFDVPGGTGSELDYHHVGMHAWVLDYVTTPTRRRRLLNVSTPWPRRTDSSVIPRPVRRPADSPD